jgi:hypothetical protein
MTNFVVIEFEKIFSPKEDLVDILYKVRKYYEYHGIPIPTNSQSVPFSNDDSYNLIPFTEDNYISYIAMLSWLSKVVKIWINPSNGFVIAYEDQQGYKFSEKFIAHLNEAPEMMKINQKEDLSIDDILDKINKYGIKSLSSREKKFLDTV